MNPDHLLERDRGVPRHAVPRLPGPHVQVIQAVQVVILHVPSEPAKQHGYVHHRRRDPRNLLLHEPQ